MPHLKSIGDAALCEIIRADLYFDIVPWHDTYAELPQFTREVADDFLFVFKLDAKFSCWKRFFHGPSHLDELFFCHVA